MMTTLEKTREVCRHLLDAAAAGPEELVAHAAALSRPQAEAAIVALALADRDRQAHARVHFSVDLPALDALAEADGPGDLLAVARSLTDEETRGAVVELARLHAALPDLRRTLAPGASMN